MIHRLLVGSNSGSVVRSKTIYWPSGETVMRFTLLSSISVRWVICWVARLYSKMLWQLW